jgi:hypothetical protein
MKPSNDHTLRSSRGNDDEEKFENLPNRFYRDDLAGYFNDFSRWKNPQGCEMERERANRHTLIAFIFTGVQKPIITRSASNFSTPKSQSNGWYKNHCVSIIFITIFCVFISLFEDHYKNTYIYISKNRGNSRAKAYTMDRQASSWNLEDHSIPQVCTLKIFMNHRTISHRYVGRYFETLIRTECKAVT